MTIVLGLLILFLIGILFLSFHERIKSLEEVTYVLKKENNLKAEQLNLINEFIKAHLKFDEDERDVKKINIFTIETNNQKEI